MVRAAVLVSGGGTNLQAIIDAKRAGKIPSAELALVVASNASAYALTRAENAGIVHTVLRKEKGEAPENYGERLLTLLRENAIDVVVLAGFLTILPEMLRGADNLRMLLYSIVLIAMMLFNQSGFKERLLERFSGNKEKAGE